MSSDLPNAAHRRALWRFLGRFALFVALLLSLAEALFRWGLPARESPYPWQDETFRLKRYDVRGPRTGLFTSGRQIQQRARWHVNDQGWNSDRPYLAAAERAEPAIALLGDSQVDGMYVDRRDHVAAVLERATGGRYAVYAYGHSGYKLSAYITVARYLAAEGIDPAIIVLTINRGDLRGSVTNLDGRLGTHHTTLTWADGRFVENPPAPYRTTRFRRLLRQSALVRYLVFNAGVNPLPGKQRDAELALSAAPVDSSVTQSPLYAEVVRYAVAEIRAALPMARIVFLVEGDRYALYRTGEAPPRLPASAVIAEVCAALGCSVLDLTATYVGRYAADGRWFNFPHNPHWDPYGHRVIGEALYAHLEGAGLLGR